MPRPLSQQARHRALEAAQELVAERGIDGFTVDGVARRSGVAKTTLYRHWASGNELLIDAIGCRIEELPTPDSGSLVGDLEQLFSVLAQRAADPAARRLLLDLLSAAAGDPELRQLRDVMLTERSRPARIVVQRAVDRGEIPAIEPDLALTLIQGPILARMISCPGPMTGDEVSVLARHIARGLGLGLGLGLVQIDLPNM